jgi:hypothetical protein
MLGSLTLFAFFLSRTQISIEKRRTRNPKKMNTPPITANGATNLLKDSSEKGIKSH